MSFIDDEGGLEASRPREAIEIVLPNETIRLATGTRNITIGSDTYTAYPSQRAELAIPTLDSGAVTELILNAKHPFVARYMRGAKSVLVNVHRVQANGDTETVWRGRITAIRFDGGTVTFTVPTRRLSLVDSRLPGTSVSTTCRHVLYGRNCGVDRDAHKVTTTITSAQGQTIKVAAIGGHADGWARFGELVHGPTGEPMTIGDQVGTTLTVPAPITGMKFGDAVTVYAGCDHIVETCRDFENVVNYGGFPDRPAGNPFIPNGFGVYQSE